MQMDELSDVNKPVVGDPGNADAGGGLGGRDAVGADAHEEANGGAETLVAQFEKSATEQLRVTLGRYKGREVFGVRVWIGLTDDTLRPTRKGVTLRVESFPQFRAAIGQLEAAINARQSALDAPAEGDESVGTQEHCNPA
jgi:hypothetical protein